MGKDLAWGGHPEPGQGSEGCGHPHREGACHPRQRHPPSPTLGIAALGFCARRSAPSWQRSPALVNPVGLRGCGKGKMRGTGVSRAETPVVGERVDPGALEKHLWPIVFPVETLLTPRFLLNPNL